jgi:hypothetical protein
MRIHLPVVLLPLLVATACGGYASPVQAGPRLQQLAAYTYDGTVHTVRTAPGTLDLITGVGPALRMVHITVPSSATIESDGRRVSLADLKPGDVIHAECRLTDQGMVAEKIRKPPVEVAQGTGG